MPSPSLAHAARRAPDACRHVFRMARLMAGRRDGPDEAGTGVHPFQAGFTAAQGAAPPRPARAPPQVLSRPCAATHLHQLTHLQSSWVDPATTAFKSCADPSRGAPLTVEQSLESIGPSLGSAATQYADADQFSASLFR